MSPTLNNIFELLDKVGQTDAADAFTMPGSFYTSEEILELEREQLFRKKWMCLGRQEELPEPGDYRATELVGEPILLMRNAERRIKAMSNVCRHRGMPLLDGSGNCKRITCSYHAWTYDLDGDLVRASGVADHHADFIRDCRLPEYPCEIWHGFIFVNLDAGAESFLESDTVKAIEPIVEHMHIEDMRVIYSDEQEWDANWKCLVENFLEGYHRKVGHPDKLLLNY